MKKLLSIHYFRLIGIGLLSTIPAVSWAQTGYQKAPPPIADILNTPPAPQISLSPTGEYLLLLEGLRYPPIQDLARPLLRLAGLRINPHNNGPHASPRLVKLIIVAVKDAEQRSVEVPKDAHLGNVSWSPDGRRFVFTHTTPTEIQLWEGNPADGKTRQVPGLVLNAAHGAPFDWLPEGKGLLCRTVPSGRGGPPVPSAALGGPVIQETKKKQGPVRTFQDLLKNPHDEKLLEFYLTSQLVLADLTTQRLTNIGEPALYQSPSLSPSGQYFLVEKIHRPFSYLHPLAAFPRTVEIGDITGKRVTQLADLPLADQVPIEGVPAGPRYHRWCPTETATVVWVEALDGGDPNTTVPNRDKVMLLPAPFQEKPVELTRTVNRFTDISWGEKDGLALVREFDRNRRWSRTLAICKDQPGKEGRVIWDRSTQDRYGDPGRPIMRNLPNGHNVLWQHEDYLFLNGQGASPRGEKPFLDRFHLPTGRSERHFQCEDQTFETVVDLLVADGSQFLTRRETTQEPPNYFVRSIHKADKRALTRFNDPAPLLRQIEKKLITYKRPDGVALSFTLYLPPNYKPGEKLPTVMWAYPREYNDPSTAGQVSGSPYRFTTITGPSHLFFALQGYAVLDGATMPVVGDPKTANDTFIDQIVASARAAIDKAEELGVTDRNRVGVGGHSYGAFMTANLLAHSDLFRAGIARSGAYNRTLTPFGFQSERRTLWEASDLYLKVSPFMFVHRIQEPLLVIHGEMDNNPGTFYMQSERLYQAIQGNGGTARFVTLPYEAHGYLARESVEHTLYEMITWFDTHVKNGKPLASDRK